MSNDQTYITDFAYVKLLRQGIQFTQFKGTIEELLSDTNTYNRILSLCFPLGHPVDLIYMYSVIENKPIFTISSIPDERAILATIDHFTNPIMILHSLATHFQGNTTTEQIRITNHSDINYDQLKNFTNLDKLLYNIFLQNKIVILATQEQTLEFLGQLYSLLPFSLQYRMTFVSQSVTIAEEVTCLGVSPNDVNINNLDNLDRPVQCIVEVNNKNIIANDSCNILKKISRYLYEQNISLFKQNLESLAHLCEECKEATTIEQVEYISKNFGFHLTKQDYLCILYVNKRNITNEFDKLIK